jgi:hypothetical protein
MFHDDSNNMSFEREQSLDYFDIVKDLFILTSCIHHKSTILPSFFPGSCFSQLSVQILFNRKEKRILFEVQDGKNLDWSIRKKRIRKESQDIKNFLEFRQASFFLSLKDSYLILKINGTWYLCAYIHIYTNVCTLIIHFYTTIFSKYCVQFNEQLISFSYFRSISCFSLFVTINFLNL